MSYKTFKYALQFFPIWIIDQILCVLPRNWALAFGERLGQFVSLFFSRRRRLMMGNLGLCFPENSESANRTIVTKVWKNIGRIACEFIRLSDINQSNFRDYFEIVGEDLMFKAKSEGKGIIFIGFHFTNWEMTGVGGNFLEGHIVAVARPIKNPYLEKWIQKKRGGGGMDIILHRDAVRGCLRALKQKKSVGILVDQNLYTGGVFVDFFGRPAATTPLPALLQSRTDAPILLLYCQRTDGKMKLIFEELPALPPTEKKEETIQQITQRVSSRIEDIIRKNPENWFWVHNRWKRQPLASVQATPA